MDGWMNGWTMQINQIIVLGFPNGVKGWGSLLGRDFPDGGMSKFSNSGRGIYPSRETLMSVNDVIIKTLKFPSNFH